MDLPDDRGAETPPWREMLCASLTGVSIAASVLAMQYAIDLAGAGPPDLIAILVATSIPFGISALALFVASVLRRPTPWPDVIGSLLAGLLAVAGWLVAGAVLLIETPLSAPVGFGMAAVMAAVTLGYGVLLFRAAVRTAGGSTVDWLWPAGAAIVGLVAGLGLGSAEILTLVVAGSTLGYWLSRLRGGFTARTAVGLAIVVISFLAVFPVMQADVSVGLLFALYLAPLATLPLAALSAGRKRSAARD